jgi:hypothetical protein
MYLNGQDKQKATRDAPNQTKPINDIVSVMKRVDTSSPEARKNEVSIKTPDGKRIKLNDEPIGNNRPATKGVIVNPNEVF